MSEKTSTWTIEETRRVGFYVLLSVSEIVTKTDAITELTNIFVSKTKTQVKYLFDKIYNSDQMNQFNESNSILYPLIFREDAYKQLSSVFKVEDTLINKYLDKFTFKKEEHLITDEVSVSKNCVSCSCNTRSYVLNVFIMSSIISALLFLAQRLISILI